MVKNSPFYAEDVGSIPGRGAKLPHAAEWLNPSTTTVELRYPSKESVHRKRSRGHRQINTFLTKLKKKNMKTEAQKVFV